MTPPPWTSQLTLPLRNRAGTSQPVDESDNDHNDDQDYDDDNYDGGDDNGDNCDDA